MKSEKIPNVLLVEDNQDDYEATLRSFKKNGFLSPITWCKSGKEAWDYLQERKDVNTPDLILLDLNMPGIDGRKLLERIKTDKQLRHIPVVILTTSADSKDVDKCYELGASTYIQKPVSFEGLAQAIRTMKDYWFDVAILPSRNKE